MRDFARDVSKASEWTGSVPAGEPSWSPAKHLLFKACQRAFFLSHCMAQGGWDAYAHPLRRECYLEKRLQTVVEWKERVLNEALRTAIDKTLRLPDAKRTAECFKTFQLEAALLVAKGAAQLRTKEWTRDPKALLLFEFHYGREDWSLVESAAREIKKAAKSLCETDMLLSLVALDRNAWRRLDEFESFKLDGTEVWAKPELSWLVGRAARFLELKCALPEGPGAALKASTLDLLAFFRFKTPSNSSIASYLAPDGSSAEPRPDAAALRRLIPESHAAICAKTRPDGSVALEDFALTEEPKRCEACRFKGICEKTR